jgi:hypothetical protein
VGASSPSLQGGDVCGDCVACIVVHNMVAARERASGKVGRVGGRGRLWRIGAAVTSCWSGGGERSFLKHRGTEEHRGGLFDEAIRAGVVVRRSVREFLFSLRRSTAGRGCGRGAVGSGEWGVRSAEVACNSSVVFAACKASSVSLA